MNLYLHIPFCRQACHYCNFHFTTSLRYREEVVKSIREELFLQKNYVQEPVETIYFGGGTPSLLSATEINDILSTVREHYEVLPGAEITIEANPDDISGELCESWQQTGINRVSIGIQSFFDDDLRLMNRAHNAQQAKSALADAKKFFGNITADLIYGIPGTGNHRWRENVEMLVRENIPHISCYALTVEPKTPLARMIAEEKIEAPSAEQQSEQFLLLIDWLEDAGYEHYEISNFAKPGFKSRHNSSYWNVGPTGEGKKYLGIGPSAHSFNGLSRQWNVSNNQQYIRAIGSGNIPAEKEELSDDQRINEFIMTSLRTREGIDLSKLEADENRRLVLKSARYAEAGMLIVDDRSIRLTRQGKLYADGIASHLFK